MRPEVHAALQSQAAGQPGAAIRKPISTLTFSIPPPSRAQAAPSKPQVPQASPTFRQSGAAGRSATASQPGQQAPPAQGSNGMKNGAAAGSLRQRYGNKGAAGNGASVAGQNGTQPLQNGNGAVGPEQGSMLPPLSRQQRVGNKGCFVKRSPQRYLGPDLVPAETYSMWDFYCDQWRPFGELLTAMEREGFLVNRCASLKYDDAGGEQAAGYDRHDRLCPAPPWTMRCFSVHVLRVMTECRDVNPSAHAS